MCLSLADRSQRGFSLTELLIGITLTIAVTWFVSGFFKTTTKEATNDRLLQNAESEYELLGKRIRSLLTHKVEGSESLTNCVANGYCKRMSFQTTFRSATPETAIVESRCLAGAVSLKKAGIKMPVCFDAPCDGTIKTSVTVAGKTMNFPPPGSETLGTVACLSVLDNNIHVNLQSFYAQPGDSSRLRSSGRIFSFSSDTFFNGLEAYSR